MKCLGFRILVVSIVGLCPVLASGWEFRGGNIIVGELVHFDHDSKTAQFRNGVSGEETSVPAADLSLRSQQQLMMSGIFRDSRPEGSRSLFRSLPLPLRLGVFPIAMIMMMGLWIAGWTLTGKANPLRAFAAFFAGWFVVAILAACYAAFANSAADVTWLIVFECLVISFFVGMVVSAIYQSSVWKGILIFALQLVGGSLAVGLVFFGAEMFIPLGLRELWWKNMVFVPLGLLS
jgi:hypothetical protein